MSTTSESFTLEPEKQSVTVVRAVEKVCGNCKLFKPWRDSDTNRIHPSKPGKCDWKIPVVDFPISFLRSGYGSPPLTPLSAAFPVSVYRDTPAETCKCFKSK